MRPLIPHIEQLKLRRTLRQLEQHFSTVEFIPPQGHYTAGVVLDGVRISYIYVNNNLYSGDIEKVKDTVKSILTHQIPNQY